MINFCHMIVFFILLFLFQHFLIFSFFPARTHKTFSFSIFRHSSRLSLNSKGNFNQKRWHLRAGVMVVLLEISFHYDVSFHSREHNMGHSGQSLIRLQSLTEDLKLMLCFMSFMQLKSSASCGCLEVPLNSSPSFNNPKSEVIPCGCLRVNAIKLHCHLLSHKSPFRHKPINIDKQTIVYLGDLQTHLIHS